MSTLLDAALDYAARGWPVFPCHPKTKRPLTPKGENDDGSGGLKRATTDPAQIRAWWTQFPKALIGVRTGPWIGAFVVDFDAGVDDETGEIFEVEALIDNLERAIEAKLPETWCVATPRGGRHLYFQIPAGAAIGNRGELLGKGSRIDVRGDGGYVCLPPSARLDGKGYAWLLGPKIKGELPAKAPQGLIDCILRQGKFEPAEPPPAKASPADTRSPVGGDDARARAIRAYALAALDRQTRSVEAATEGGRNIALNNAALSLGHLVGAGALADSVVRAALEGACHKNGLIKSDGFKSVRDTLSSGLKKGISQPADLSKVGTKGGRRAKETREDAPGRISSGGGGSRGPGRRVGRGERGRPPWLDDCLADSRGEPRGNLANAMLALRADTALANLFAYDKLYCGPMLMAAIPSAPFKEEGEYPKPLTDIHAGCVQEYLQLAGLAQLGKDVVHQALDQRAAEFAFHPVRDYLESLKWDGQKRLHNWLTYYFGVEPSEYASRVGVMFMISLIARVYVRPFSKVDHVLVLEGPQGKLKSTACAVLGGAWFSDQLPNIETKDASQHLRGKWLIEIPEMAALDKKEAAHLKAFVTRNTERYRPPFGRKEVEEPRQCVFIATTNELEYLRDPTGARRFWPVLIVEIDIDGLKADRDQLFAEALHMFRAGETWWPTREFEEKHAKPQQSERYESDVWEDPVGVWLAGQRHDAKKEGTRARVTIKQVAIDCLRFEVQRVTKADERRIRAALRRLNWRLERSDGNAHWSGKRYWVAIADDAAEQVAV
jgi:Virulence-associated protein E-like domain/Bifunctional DNA primase/polymerase, N-terminal